MTSRNSSHAEKTGEMSSKQSTPKVQVQRSVSQETITIHFSAFGKEEEEEEEEFKEFLDEELDDQSIVTALEAKEDLCFEHPGHDLSGPATSLNVANSASLLSSSPAVLPTAETVTLLDSPSASRVFSAVPLVLSPSSHSCHTVDVSGASVAYQVGSVEQKSNLSSSPSSSPSKSTGSSTISSSRPFKGLVKSLSTDVEPKEPTPPMRHRQLMKTLVKSLSTDTSKQESEAVSYRPPDSKLNLHLFKQFTQPRATSGDSKTAPSSPLTSPSDTRSFFKVPEMEAKIEDTKRRLSEVMYEPLQLLSKIMGDESSSHRPKALSSSASELSNLSSLNGHLESNNNYSIKEEECDSEGDISGGDSVSKSDQSKAAEEHGKDTETPSSQSSSTKDVSSKPSLVLEKCSLSALVSREDEEFCELYSEDFLLLEDESKTDKPAETVVDPEMTEETVTVLSSEDENNLDVQQPKPPLKTLYVLTLLVYAYLIIPLPGYLSGLLLGMALGFMVAVCVIWLVTPRTHEYLKFHKSMKKRWNAGALDIKEPDILKGWMNEIYNYDPETYHATLTHSVYVRLEGSTLRLSKPNKNISRRALYNEPKPDVTYVSQKIYELTESRISLVPKSLARKRIWNKKYPICIELAKQEDFMAKAQTEKENAEEKSSAEKVDSNSEESKKPQDGAKCSSQKDQVLYLFGRTGREKEEWFRRFLLASRLRSEAKKPPSLCASKSGILAAHSRADSQPGALTHSRSSSKGNAEEITAQPKHKDLTGNVRQKMLLDYNIYMAKCVPQEKKSPSGSPVLSADSSPTAVKKLPDAHEEAEEEEQEAWVNALLGRIFWDFLGEKYWSDLVSKKIQMKLSKIKLPYFMNELTLTELDMGIAVPKILQAFKPSIDHRGLWVDLEMSYNGSFLMTLETKMNLTKLGKEPLGEALKVGEIGREGFRPRAYCLADSDEESSSAGSSEEDDAPEPAGEKQMTPGAEGYVGGSRTSKLMRIVDKITKSKYFQKATETEFIKKKIEEVSNTPLLLTVEVQECRGTLVINIPPPPTDRIWYGFRRPPYLELKARPKLGEREVTLVHVTDWIARKLEQEFQKIFVMPNMDDVYIPLMHSAMDPRSSTCPQDLSTEASDQP
ncbi:PREDICTED: testis-expressed sequence 2 protein [Lepidothrix coronata]|uniref:Testis-expressed sequence 2 protein n=1 Tax=Lepidothrix coronata TaxID=321398 RepID=A0A6J0GZY5_9PASS|nr:PREDICTED: testis-expressed sequence 2 protein [Lepidothrix coronata]XP_017667427.1 PREDICTED: testis-expressed sequence 2 protein [Lepidothrix coronata]XP_017667428.1 PREDICTED: testis-expressed sequence 2 protein [Lepidothrix coronata]XP_017667429.1 PREDICTED: testis-expressed sequence 2 protein [Lepidothrix coronata]